jgi:hypothetical protein
MLVVGDPVFSIADTDSKLIASHDAISLVGFTLGHRRYNVGATELRLQSG